MEKIMFKPGTRVKRSAIEETEWVPAGTKGVVLSEDAWANLGNTVYPDYIYVLWANGAQFKYIEDGGILLLDEEQDPIHSQPVYLNRNSYPSAAETPHIQKAVDAGEACVKRKLLAWPVGKNLIHKVNRETGMVDFYWEDVK